MDMTSLDISLLKPMKDFIEARVLEDYYNTPSEYVRALIRDVHGAQYFKLVC